MSRHFQFVKDSYSFSPSGIGKQFHLQQLFIRHDTDFIGLILIYKVNNAIKQSKCLRNHDYSTNSYFFILFFKTINL